MLTFRANSGDQILKDHLETAPRNATYTSNTTQNEIIVVIGDWIRNKIISGIQGKNKLFSVVADEARDVANLEQMPIIIRYINMYYEIQESFIGFVECESGTSGHAIASLIEESCHRFGLNMQLCRGQGYDGAGNMSGSCSGASAIIRSKYPKAIYFHCASHKLNLCIANSCQLRTVSNMMSVITGISNFYNYSPKRQKSLESCLGDYSESLKSKLLPFCKTRWVERLNALEVTIDLIEAVVYSLSEISVNTGGHWNRDTISQASSFLKSIDFEFLINLLTAQKILSYTSGITTELQKKGLDLADAISRVKLVIRMLESIRTTVSSFYHTVFAEACEIAQKIDVDVKKPRTCGRQINRRNAVAMHSEQLSGQQLVEEYYRINLAIPFLDETLGTLRARFDCGQEVVMKGMLLLPVSVISIGNWKTSIQPFIEFYSDELPCSRTITSELCIWELSWKERWELKWKELKEQHLVATGIQWRRKGGAGGAGAPPIFFRWGLSPPNIWGCILLVKLYSS